MNMQSFPNTPISHPAVHHKQSYYFQFLCGNVYGYLVILQYFVLYFIKNKNKIDIFLIEKYFKSYMKKNVKCNEKIEVYDE